VTVSSALRMCSGKGAFIGLVSCVGPPGAWPAAAWVGSMG